MEHDNKNVIKEPTASYNTKIYTYADYLKFEYEEMVELIRGKIFRMSAGPKSFHQDISRNLGTEIANFLKGKNCKIYYAPFDVVLPVKNESKDKSTTVVQPDICVICDRSKIDEAGCFGAPDFIVEIISPSTSKKDMNDKLSIYEEAGVKEYWIVFPKDETINMFSLKDGKYRLQKMYTKTEQISPVTLPDLTIDLESIFNYD